jgi:hypothetical protein
MLAKKKSETAGQMRASGQSRLGSAILVKSVDYSRPTLGR